MSLASQETLLISAFIAVTTTPTAATDEDAVIVPETETLRTEPELTVPKRGLVRPLTRCPPPSKTPRKGFLSASGIPIDGCSPIEIQRVA